jgi:hypothetical protein
MIFFYPLIKHKREDKREKEGETGKEGEGL